MKIYTVHTKENSPPENAVLVPEAFSWFAAIPFVGAVWALFERAWLLALVLLAYAATYFIPYLNEGEPAKYAGILRFGIVPFIGVWANDIRRFGLKLRGFKLNTIVGGRNKSDAEFRFCQLLNKS